MASSTSSSSLSSTSSSSSSAMSSTSSSSSSTRAAASSSPALATASPAPAPAPPAPGLLDDTAFPALGTAPPRPPRSGIGARPTTSAERRSGRETIIGLPLSLYGRLGVAVAGTAATAEELDSPAETAATDEERDAEEETAATDEEREAEKTSATDEEREAEKTSATDEEREAEKTSATAEAGGTGPETTSTAVTISARPPICASPGSFAAAAALLSGAPTLLPAVQAFGGYTFGTTFGDLFQDLRRAAAAAAAAGPPPPPPLQPPRYLSLVPLQGPPPLQAPRYLNLAPRALVPLQGPPPQFAPPGLAHYASAMQFAARPQHMRFHLYAPGRPALFVDVQWRYEVTPPPLPHHPQGALQLYGYPPVPPVGHVGSPCWDCQFPQAALPFPCGHVFLCRHCHARRFSCPCCDGVVPPPGVPF